MANGNSSSRLLDSEKKQVKRSAYSYEIQPMVAILETLVEAAVLARRYGFNQILILSSSKRLVHHFSWDSNPNWQERTTFADILSS